MRKIFIDTGAFLAKEIAGDQHHAAASRYWQELVQDRVALYSTEHVLDESATLLARRTSYAWAAAWGRDVLASGIRWLATRPEELPGVLRLMEKLADQRVSFTDCVSFTVMKREGLRDAFGFDRHFTAAGFRLREPADE